MRLGMGWAGVLLLAGGCCATGVAQAVSTAFAVAVIRPSAQRVEFERNGRVEMSHGRLLMRDVTVSSCIEWAYGITGGQLLGPASLHGAHYDVTAKADADASEGSMREAMRVLLRERFGLALHPESRTLWVYTLRVDKGGVKMRAAAPEEAFFRENSAKGTVARAITMAELATFLSDPLASPVVDRTELPGRWDFDLDFTPYVDMQQADVRPDVVAVLKAALKGELGIVMERSQQPVPVLVVDRVTAPTEN